MSKKNKKKKPEFSKRLVCWALVITTVSVAASFILAAIGRDGCSDVTGEIIRTCVAIAVAYEAKSFGEKNSRNKYRIDEDGFPIDGDQGSEG